jgi:hypothetical protein
MNTNRHSLLRALSAAALVGLALLPATAQAWWRGGVFVGLPPVVVGPPAYPPPYYYPPYYAPAPYAPGYPPPGYGGAQPGYGQPPPQGQAQPQAQQDQQQPAQTPAPELSQANTPIGSTCYAGVYVCQAAPQTHVGTGCACPGLGAPSYGVVQ